MAVWQQLDRAYFRLFREYPLLVRLALIAGGSECAISLINNYALPLYLANDLHLRGIVIGAVSSTFLVAEMLLKFPLARLSDRWGRKPFVALGPLVSVLNPLIIVYLPITWWRAIFPVRAVDGAGSAALWPPLFALVGDVVRPRSRAAAMSILNTIYMGAAGGAVVLGGVAVGVTGSHLAPFYLASLLFLVSSVAGWGLPALRSHSQQDAPSPSFPSPDACRTTTSCPLALILTVTFLMTLSGLIAAGFVVLYFHQVVGLSEFQFSGLLVGLAVPVLLLGLPLGHAADRWGKSRAVRVGLVVAALSLAAVPSCRSIASLAAVGMVLVLSQILAIPAWLALVSELAPTVKRGELMGLVMTAEGVGGAIGPIIGGWMWDWRPGYLFYASAVAMGAAAVVAAVALRTRRSAVPG